MFQDIGLALVWYITFTAFGLLVLPLSMLVFRQMPDCGILLSRPLGWLLIAFTAWILAYIKILPFNIIGLSVVIVLWLAFSIYLFQLRKKWMQRRWRIHWRTALNGEIITLFVYLLLIFIRREDPAVDSTEKPMDMMFLNGLTEGSQIPPLDPWFAGGIINYHYGGYLLHSVPAKLTGIPAEFVYNLAIAMLTALAASCAFVLGRALFGRCLYGAVTVPCTLFLGNMASVLEFFNYGRLLESMWELRWGYLWKTSRVIQDEIGGVPQDTINEYPLFTILWGDLHPHCSNLPFVMFALCLIYALYNGLTHLPKKNAFYLHIPLMGITAVALAFIFPTNLFDFPVASLVLGGVVVSSLIYLWSFKHTQSISTVTIILRMTALFLPIVAYTLAAPFWLEFKSPIQGPMLHISEYHTGIMEFLLVFGLHTAATIAYLIMRTVSFSHLTGKEGLWFILLIVAMLFVLLWGWQGHLVFAMAPVIVLFLTAILIYQSMQDPQKSHAVLSENFALILCIIGWSLIAGCEFIHLSESYSSKRINTLFKFHLPAWLFFGVALPVMLYHASRAINQLQLKIALNGLVAILFMISLIAPGYIVSSVAYMKFLKWKNNVPDLATLNGIDYMKRDRPHQYAIVQWLRENAAHDAKILELPGYAYTQDSFASTYTGRLSYIGWENHEGLWRAHAPEIAQRSEEIIQFFIHPNWLEALDFLKQRDIEYVILKTPEHNSPSDSGYQARMQKFEIMKQGVFREHLEPIIVEKGIVHNPNMVFELYRVPKDQN